VFRSSYGTRLVYKKLMVAMCVQILRCSKSKYLQYHFSRHGGFLATQGWTLLCFLSQQFRGTTLYQTKLHMSSLHPERKGDREVGLTRAHELDLNNLFIRLNFHLFVYSIIRVLDPLLVILMLPDVTGWFIFGGVRVTTVQE
jgi:hypothetical protein